MLVNMSYNVKFRKIEFRCALINAAFILHQFEVTTTECCLCSNSIDVGLQQTHLVFLSYFSNFFTL